MNEPRLHLDAYLARINYHGRRCANPAVLAELHEAHASAIPFENIDVLLGKPIKLDLPSLEAKLVAGRRGGYCFEQNALFAAALEAEGFTVARLAARVRYHSTHVNPRTHMVLRVDFGRESWLADVGFGGEGLLRPIRLREGEVSRQSFWTYRIAREPAGWVLQLDRGDRPLDLYVFTDEPQLPVDYEMANWFTSTHPDSIFVRTLTVQRSSQAERLILRNREFTTDHGGAPQSRTLDSDEKVLQVIREKFGIALPGDVKLPALREPVG